MKVRLKLGDDYHRYLTDVCDARKRNTSSNSMQSVRPASCMGPPERGINNPEIIGVINECIRPI